MSATGHEEEFRALFAEEAMAQLEHIGERALDLEQAGRDPELVASLFRDAHTIKSTAALVGLAPIGRLAHVLEDAFEQLRSGGRTATPELIDAVLRAVDVLRELIPAMVAGADRTADADAATAALREVVTRWEAGAATVADEILTEVAAAPAGAEAMLVPVERLNGLVRLASEAVTARSAVEQAAVDRGADPEAEPEIVALTSVVNGLQQQVLKARTVAVGTVVAPLRRAVRDAARTTGKLVRWEIEGEGVELDRHVLERLRDPLLHLVRNAVDHGIETAEEREQLGKPAEAVVRLQARPLGGEVELLVSDDGGGLTAEPDQIFGAGFSTKSAVTELSGRGVGLDVVRTTVEKLRGRVEVESEPGVGCAFRIVVPLTLAVLPCLIAVVGGQRFAVPFHAVERVLESPEEFPVEGRREVIVGDRTVPVQTLGRVLELDAGPADGPALLLRGLALRVDELAGRRDVLVKELGGALPALPLFAGASVEADGSVLLVLDAAAVVERAASLPRTGAPVAPAAVHAPTAAPRVLVVEDALTVRELQRAILQRAGYQVDTAADGEEALSLLGEAEFDLVMTDVEMPRMNGFRLTEAIRAHPRLASLPVVIVTSLASDADRRRGLESGADAYLVKSEFDENALLDAVHRTLGRVA